MRRSCVISLDQKIAVVIGGSQGIGASVCEKLAKEGATVFVVASRSLEKARVVVNSIIAAGGKATPSVCDVCSRDAIETLFRDVLDQVGRIDILVNSAGVFYPTPVGETGEADVERMLDINVKGVFLAISAVAPTMKAQHYGKIVNISSCAGVMGIKGYALYCAAKAGVIMMTRALALELAPEGININAVAPGNTATPMNLDVRTDPAFAGFLQAMTERTPSGRTYSSPEDMANLVAFLASDDSRAIHGSTVLIDEGLTAGL